MSEIDLSDLFTSINEIVSEDDNDDDEIIAVLRDILNVSTIDHTKVIMTLPTLKDAHIYCVTQRVSAQQFGPLIQNYIIEHFGFTINKASDINGDCSKEEKNYEIKVSLGGNQFNKFNYVQIRPSHNIHTYILTAYHLDKSSLKDKGKLFIFIVSKADMNTLLTKYGTYAHGTKKEHGLITLEDLINPENKKEYALRPLYGDACWKALLPYEIQESAL